MKVLAATLLAIALLALVLWRPWTRPADSGTLPGNGERPAPAGQAEPPPLPAADVPAPLAEPPPANLSPAEIDRVRDAIDNLELTFRDYAASLGGNPVGTNAEITAALLGDNLNQLKLEIPGGSTLNANRELCDPWGTPWFFHQLSRTKMEVRSAGRDKQLHTDDDFVR
jgi:hypothetical protein